MVGDYEVCTEKEASTVRSHNGGRFEIGYKTRLEERKARSATDVNQNQNEVHATKQTSNFIGFHNRQYYQSLTAFLRATQPLVVHVLMLMHVCT